MEHRTELNHFNSATLVAASSTANLDQKSGTLRTGIVYRKTRSTLALNAYDLFDLNDDQTTDMLKSLMRLCRSLNRDEILIECLEVLTENGEAWAISECVNSIQSDITRTSLTMNLCPPRVALERRGQHFDLRIYQTFH